MDNGQQFSLFMVAVSFLAFGMISLNIFRALRGLWRAGRRSWSEKSLSPIRISLGKALAYTVGFLLLPFMADGGRNGRK